MNSEFVFDRVPKLTIAALADVTGPDISRWIISEKNLPPAKVRRLEAVLIRLEWLLTKIIPRLEDLMISPLTIDTGNTEALKKLFEQMDEGYNPKMFLDRLEMWRQQFESSFLQQKSAK
jgi:hypothetical protein